jgi:putative spermidine/putrescine transport system permease protein
VLVPLLRRRLGEALLLGGLVSWGQLAITLLVGGGLVRTLPVELLSIVQSGNDQIAALAALVLGLPPMLAVGVLAVGARRTGATV